jgi:hypothetical protein
MIVPRFTTYDSRYDIRLLFCFRPFVVFLDDSTRYHYGVRFAFLWSMMGGWEMPFFLSQLYGLCMFSAYVTDKMHVSRLRSKNAIAPYWVAQSNMILLKTKLHVSVHVQDPRCASTTVTCKAIYPKRPMRDESQSIHR